MPYFGEPVQRVKMQTTNMKYLAILHTQTSSNLLLSTAFLFCQVFLFVSHWAGKAKRIEIENFENSSAINP